MLTSAFLGLALLSGFLVSVVEARDVPSSARSRAAVARVKPALLEALAEKGLRFGAPVFLRVFKETSELEVWLEEGDEFRLFRTYGVCDYSGELGPKRESGDLQAPEGFYFVDPDRMNPWSQYHLSFNLGYPNRYDRHHGRTGDAIMIHGDCVSIGCYAMTDDGIEEIYALADAALRNGQPFFRVHAFPFRMTAANMERHKESEWRAFWDNLREGYDHFERAKRPPNVEVRGDRYVFEEARGFR